MREYLKGDDMPALFPEIYPHLARALFYRNVFGERDDMSRISVAAFEQWCQKHNRLDVIPLMLAHLSAVVDDQADDQSDDMPPPARKIRDISGYRDNRK